MAPGDISAGWLTGWAALLYTARPYRTANANRGNSMFYINIALAVLVLAVLILIIPPWRSAVAIFLRSTGNVIAAVAVWLWRRRRQIIVAWFLFWLVDLVLTFSPLVTVGESTLIQAFLNALAPLNFGHPWTLVKPGTIAPEPSWQEVAENLVETCQWYFFLVLPGFYLFKSIRTPFALPPFDPKIMESVIRRMRFRSLMMKLWAAFTVLLIIGTLVIGILLFLQAGHLFDIYSGKEEAIQNSGDVNLQPADIAKNKPGGAADNPFYISVKLDLNTVIYSLASRIGAVVIFIFFVNILLQLYRDNHKQAAFYDRWADALQLAGTDPDLLKKYTDLFFLEKLDYEKPARSPIESAASVLKNTVNKLDRLPK